MGKRIKWIHGLSRSSCSARFSSLRLATSTGRAFLDNHAKYCYFKQVICSACWCEVESYAHGRKCHDCYNAYMRRYMLRRYHQRRKLAVAKLGGKCIDCGTQQDLELDHDDPKSKRFSIAKIWSYSDGRFGTELAKCLLRCTSCHKIKTYGSVP
jgi:hypothetical protein